MRLTITDQVAAVGVSLPLRVVMRTAGRPAQLKARIVDAKGDSITEDVSSVTAAGFIVKAVNDACAVEAGASFLRKKYEYENLEQAARTVLDLLNHLTTELFSRGGDQVIRERLADALEQLEKRS